MTDMAKWPRDAIGDFLVRDHDRLVRLSQASVAKTSQGAMAQSMLNNHWTAFQAMVELSDILDEREEARKLPGWRP